MPATTQVRKLWPFYVENLRLYLDQADSFFACPVCLRTFGSTVLDSPAECDVSAGHIFPECIGGNEVTLECRECNNSLGSSVDASLGGEFRWQKFQVDGGERKGLISTAEGKRPVSVTSNESGLQIREDAKHPLPVAKTEECMKNLFEQSWSLKIDLQYNPHKVRVALFHSAHLMMFRLFGYEYALSEGGKAVGRWLCERTLPIGVAEACRNLVDPNVLPLTPGMCGVAIVNHQVRCFSVCVPVYAESIRRLILLPGFDRNDLNAYMSTFDGTSKTMTLQVRQIGEHPPVTALSDPQYKWFGRILLEQGSAAQTS